MTLSSSLRFIYIFDQSGLLCGSSKERNATNISTNGHISKEPLSAQKIRRNRTYVPTFMTIFQRFIKFGKKASELIYRFASA
jgi:hypothetical protein